jgi:hypothetical protein
LPWFTRDVPLAYPRSQLAALHELSARILEHRGLQSEREVAARDLLIGFFEHCMRTGLDKILVDLAETYAPLDLEDHRALADHPQLAASLAAAINLDDVGPRNQKPLQLADALLACLTLEVVDEPDRTITLAVRDEVAAAIASVIDAELSIPNMRAAFIAKGRELCDSRHHAAYDKIAAALDDSGVRILKQPKVPIDALHAAQQALFDARVAVISGAAKAAIDRALPVIERANKEAAARIDQPVTYRVTPRDAAIARACETRTQKHPAAIAKVLLDSLSELARVAWQEPDKVARSYGASQTFAVGERISHPKFGCGTVVASIANRIEVEFPDGKRTLVHVPPKH